MKPIKVRAIESALLSKGFKKANRDHKWFFLYVDGKKTGVRTKISRGKEEYSGGLLRSVLQQVRLNRGEFQDFVACPLSGKQYAAILAERGEIRLDQV